MVAAADPSLPAAVIEAAVDAAAPGGQALRHLADALAAGPAALRTGAPPVAGRLAAELAARLSHRDRPGVRGLRPGRPAAVPRRRRRRDMPAVPHLAAGQALRHLRQDQARGRVRRARPGGLRGLPPPG